MSISVNGQSCVPPGFRFHPTEEELLNYYLRKKVASQQIDLDVIRDVDLNKLEPWDIQERCKIGSGPQNDWYFFSHKDKKYPTGTRTNRATAAGFWKATGRDKAIYNAVSRIGMRKTLVFYKGRAPHGLKSDWIMHEYRLLDADDSSSAATAAMVTASSVAASEAAGQQGPEDGWVVCRVFKKKHHHKDTNSGSGSGSGNKKAAALRRSSSSPLYSSGDDAALDQILHYMGRSSAACKQEHDSPRPAPAQTQAQARPTSRYLRPIETALAGGHGFMKLPPLESPSSAAAAAPPNTTPVPETTMDWAMMDRLVASHLNGQLHDDHASTAVVDDDHRLCSAFDDGAGEDNDDGGLAFYSAAATRLLGAAAGAVDDDLWSFARSAERLSHHGSQ
ncbi:uncharacterized protein LOC100821210 [Brachypodium distachyon]|uniref:NAC domain-containing protein 43-like n=1 Tax=Brachypodium distachyon TaxID=15368 RepID=I1I0H7_BRADI|nr:NAC domain-containing protein 43-like [Brachypodium distachyon]AFJ91968.1 SWN8 [Brachypodium distachyon]KQJ94869.1 hypothetical protein BRADI_3g13727v3 [Brachypodium distachyon]|eukprot:NP_001289809.1 uncharacterized protein LOC100821210 [Brachypodium distachyon]